MKGKNHLRFTIVFILFVLLVVISSNLLPIQIINEINPIVLISGIILIVLGSLLPDADSTNRKSFIYYTPFFPIAYFLRLLEAPIALLLCRPIGHRQSLHTMVGIVITSFSIAYLFLISISYFMQPSIGLFFFMFFCLSIGQFLHILQDWHFTVT